MNRNTILIRNINHLTDARYFAAMGVDWISIPLTQDDQSFALWHALADWIEGVYLAAEVDGQDEMLLAKAIIEAKPEGIVSNIHSLASLSEGMKLFLESNDSEVVASGKDVYQLMSHTDFLDNEMRDLMDQSGLFLEADWTPALLDEVLSSGYSGGICFSGGEEQEIGMRDYEKMDELLELLQ